MLQRKRSSQSTASLFSLLPDLLLPAFGGDNPAAGDIMVAEGGWGLMRRAMVVVTHSRSLPTSRKILSTRNSLDTSLARHLRLVTA